MTPVTDWSRAVYTWANFATVFFNPHNLIMIIKVISLTITEWLLKIYSKIISQLWRSQLKFSSSAGHESLRMKMLKGQHLVALEN